MDIRGLDKARVLKALFNRATCRGMGALSFTPAPMSDAQAAELMSRSGPTFYFDYVQGRVLKVSLRGEEVDTALYNRDNGSGAAEDAVRREFGAGS